MLIQAVGRLRCCTSIHNDSMSKQKIYVMIRLGVTGWAIDGSGLDIGERAYCP